MREIHLASGCLVTFMRTDRMPCFANDLQYRLQFPDVWQAPPRFPAGPSVRSSAPAIARQRAIPLSATSFARPRRRRGCSLHWDRSCHSGFSHAQARLHRAISCTGAFEVRGVIAVADRIYEGQCVIFLDLRQVAEGVQFVVLEVPYVMLPPCSEVVPLLDGSLK